MRLTERDYKIMKEIDRWRACTGKHIKFLSGFSGQRSADRRLKLLIEADYISRKKYLYGVPSIYSITSKGKILINAPKRMEKIKVEQIVHDMTVIDAAIYFNLKNNIDFDKITTEKQLHRSDGFGIRKHRPDFIFNDINKTNCVEVELSLKAKTRLENIIKDNFLAYDTQFWIVPDSQPKIKQILIDSQMIYTNTEIINLEEVKNYVSKFI